MHFKVNEWEAFNRKRSFFIVEIALYHSRLVTFGFKIKCSHQVLSESEIVF